MQTVLRTLERAFAKIQVKQAGVDLTSEEIADGISEMNAMMWVNDADGLGIGWSDVASETEILPVPDYVIPFVENGLALRMSNEFGMPIKEGVLGMYEEALRVIEKNTVRIPKIPYPNILPTGSGNGSIYDTSRYFEDENAGGLTGGTAGYLKDQENNTLNTSQSNNGDTP